MDYDTNLPSSNIYCDKFDRKKHNRTCYETTPALSFTAARNWCLERGGELTHNDDELWMFANDAFNLNGQQLWLLGSPSSQEARIVRPHIASQLLEPKVLTSEGVESCGVTDCSGNLPGLCAFSPDTDDIVTLSEVSNGNCDISECSNVGTCWPRATNEIPMCDCDPLYYGDRCEKLSVCESHFTL